MFTQTHLMFLILDTLPKIYITQWKDINGRLNNCRFVCRVKVEHCLEL
jgi:hypothetical protein